MLMSDLISQMCNTLEHKIVHMHTESLCPRGWEGVLN